jgi:hypothetical protein
MAGDDPVRGRLLMTIAIPFFGRKAASAAFPRGLDPVLPPRPRPLKAEAPRVDPRPFRIFVRPEPTLFQRCLATHMYFAARKSALD